MAEIIVVVAIIAILSAILLARLPVLRTQTRINTTAANIQRVIREARRRSTSIAEFKKGSGLYPSYGVFFDMSKPTQVMLYADCVFDDNGDGTIDDKDTFTFVATSNKCLGTNGFVETTQLETTIRISAIRTFTVNQALGSSQTNGAVEYLRPEPSVWISDQNGNLIGTGGIAIDITDTANVYKKTIIIWITGDVDIL